MKEFIEKLIGRLEEYKYSHLIEHDSERIEHCKEKERYCQGNDCSLCVWDKATEIVNQLAEEYKHCIKSSCSNCEVYDKEKHYCPKWCDVIKGTVEEIEENHDNDFCEWQEISAGGITAVKEPHRKKLFNHDHEQQFCPYCGKKIKIAPYHPKGE